MEVKITKISDITKADANRRIRNMERKAKKEGLIVGAMSALVVAIGIIGTIWLIL